jgi:O-antigen ligase
VVVVGAAVALNGPISHEFKRFVRPEPPGNSADLRARLTDPGNNGRIDMWRVAWRRFKAAPVLGHGAGTFEDTWARYRPNQQFVRDAHSLYLETLDELGVVGFLLLVGPILVILVGAM